MKLEVGMYVRIKNGIIDEVIIEYNGVCNNPNCNLKHISCRKNYYDEEEIKKFSYNIIELIEVGDYVNGRLVCKNDEENYLYLIGFDADGNYYEDSLKDVKSIVTKEQFESISYKVD